MNTKYLAQRAIPLKPYQWGEQTDDPAIIKLNTNENPYPPSPAVIAALQGALDLLRTYPDPSNIDLKQAISTSLGIAVESIFIGNGSDDVLMHCFQAFYDDGGRLISPEITYGFYSALAQLFNITVQPIPLNPDLSLNIDLFCHNTAPIILANPNAQTGLLVSQDALRTILAANPDQLVIIDEAYIDFAAASCLNLLEEFTNLLVIQTCSKSRALANLRLGFAFGSTDLIQALHRVRDCINPYNVDTLAMKAAQASFEDAAYFSDTLTTIQNTREAFKQFLRSTDFAFTDSQANFVLIEHPTIAAQELYQRLLEAKILVRYFHYPERRDYLRITIGTQEQMEQVATTLNAITRRKP